MVGTAFIVGSGFFRDKLPGKPVRAKTHFGSVNVFEHENVIFLQRHGEGLPPHKIKHRANIAALKELGAKRIISFNSVGSLKKSIKPGEMVVPNDFFCPWSVPTFFDDRIKHVIPEIDMRLAEELLKACKQLKLKAFRGVYVQTAGPRFETAAEIKFLATVGDVVGMTFASEATLAMELGIPIASACSVDNYANGIGKKLTVEEVERNRRFNHGKLLKLIEALS